MTYSFLMTAACQEAGTSIGDAIEVIAVCAFFGFMLWLIIVKMRI